MGQGRIQLPINATACTLNDSHHVFLSRQFAIRAAALATDMIAIGIFVNLFVSAPNYYDSDPEIKILF